MHAAIETHHIVDALVLRDIVWPPLLDCSIERSVRDGRISDISDRPSDGGRGRLDRSEVYSKCKYGVLSVR